MFATSSRYLLPTVHFRLCGCLSRQVPTSCRSPTNGLWDVRSLRNTSSIHTLKSPDSFQEDMQWRLLHSGQFGNWRVHGTPTNGHGDGKDDYWPAWFRCLMWNPRNISPCAATLMNNIYEWVASISKIFKKNILALFARNRVCASKSWAVADLWCISAIRLVMGKHH